MRIYGSKISPFRHESPTPKRAYSNFLSKEERLISSFDKREKANNKPTKRLVYTTENSSWIWE